MAYASSISPSAYAYKRRFGVTRLPLIDISAALSWHGRPYGLRDHMVRAVRSSMQGRDVCSVSHCYTKRIDALWPEFHSDANLSHMLG